MTSLTFFGAINEIGGNKILLEDSDTRIFLDFGLCFNRYGSYFSPFITPRQGLLLKDYISLGLLPNIQGLYRADFENRFRDSTKEPLYDAIVLSHPHIDHAGFISFIRPDIPLYASNGAIAILKAMEQTSFGFNEFTAIKEKFKIRPSKREKEKVVRDRGSIVQREVHTVKSTFTIGDFTIHTYPVDHSVPGANAYVIETSEGAIVYTGDIRFHGWKAEESKEFVKQAAKFDPIIMISEGTRIKEQKKVTENDLEKKLTEIIKNVKGLTLTSFPVRDFDRMQSFINAAKTNGRELVISMRQAYTLNLLEQHHVERIPDISEIKVFVPKKGWGIYNDPNYPLEIQMQDFYKWEKEMLDKAPIVTAEDIKNEQYKYVLRVEPTEFKYLFDIEPSSQSQYIRSLTEPVDEEMEIQQQKIDNWLKHFGLFPYRQLHCSGHASGVEITQMIKNIAPKTVIPIHTETSSSFQEVYPHVRIVQQGKRVEL